MEGFYEYLNTLPQPLSREEQNTLLRRFYATRDDEARDLIISHNLRLALDCVRHFACYNYDLEDLMQEATIELAHVLDNKFNINRGVDSRT